MYVQMYAVMQLHKMVYRNKFIIINNNRNELNVWLVKV